MKKNILFILISCISFYSFCQVPILSEDTLHWRSTKKLSWTDFKGKPTPGAEAEQRVYMAMLGSFVKKNPLKPAVAEIIAVFDRKQSLVSKSDQSPEGLAYFQVMFDIYELHARKLKKTLKETKLGMNPEKIFSEKYKAAIAALDEEIDAYKEESQEGNNLKAVSEWKERITKELAVLNSF